jgi:hypothetical protein
MPASGGCVRTAMLREPQAFMRSAAAALRTLATAPRCEAPPPPASLWPGRARQPGAGAGLTPHRTPLAHGPTLPPFWLLACA